ncbi:hypothetical protein F5Y19DRAFT_139552 [Xylariaceae sp. FL1651]|nr:hypothetical protein F5Y19DRAFT_139552 [Xylariaceae sp. FL1651]
MSSTDDPSRLYSDNDAPTHNPPWPYVDAFTQARLERKFLVEGATINFDTLPKMQSWASWFGITDNVRVMSVLRRVSSHSNVAQRPLTSLEANAIGEHAATTIRYFSWSAPLSVVLAAAAAWKGRRTFRFPLYTPKMKKFDPFSFPTRGAPLLSGKWAAAMWHIVRLAAYKPLVLIPTALFFGSIYDQSFQSRMLRDPRLTGLIGDIRRNAKHNTAMAQQRHRQVGTPTPSGVARPQSSQHPTDGAYQDPMRQDYGSTDYTSQPGGTYEKSGLDAETFQPSQSDWPRSASAQSASRRPSESASSGFSSSRESDNSDLFDDDEGSPVAPSAREAESEQRPLASSGSAWDRIRQQARSDKSTWAKGDSSGQERGWAQLRQDKTQTPREVAPKTDGFSYSHGDEEREKRNYEKEQAQKEFDALVEAERRGEGSSGNRRT